MSEIVMQKFKGFDVLVKWKQACIFSEVLNMFTFTFLHSTTNTSMYFSWI